ncbi:hypothetical protein YC2023_019401 [Brassica napus]
MAHAKKLIQSGLQPCDIGIITTNAAQDLRGDAKGHGGVHGCWFPRSRKRGSMIKLKEGGLVFKRPKANECGCYLRKKTLLCGLRYRVTETVNSECVSETYDQIL